MTGRPHGASNEQDQDNVKVGRIPGKSVFTTWPVFPLLFVIAFFMPQGIN